MLPLSRRWLLIFIPSLVVSVWLGMMLVHESGHMVAAYITGGSVQKLFFRPLAFSRTDVSPNPHPMIVAWGGPFLGSLLPLILCMALRVTGWRSFFAEIFAAFCLIANGTYIGLGSFDQIGDAGDLLHGGNPAWTLWLFGAVAVSAGMLLLHLQGRRLGFSTRITRADIWIAATAAVLLLIFGMLMEWRS